MRNKTLSPALGLAIALLSATTVAEAADWNGGSVKDGRGGILVPEPIPYAETFKWYLRADIGGGWTSAPAISEKGMT
jgi:hypothetical protein